MCARKLTEATEKINEKSKQIGTDPTHLKHHGLRGSASPVLTGTGFVNGRWQFSTPHRINTP